VFKINIPSYETVGSLVIFRTLNDREIFRQSFDIPATDKIAVSLKRISDAKWEILASNQGRRIVRRLEPQNKVLIFDLDDEDKIIEGIEGETIEIQYQISPSRVRKQLVQLQ
jgi:hypothetical protein